MRRRTERPENLGSHPEDRPPEKTDGQVLPLEETVFPDELDGRLGKNRAPTDRLQIDARNDPEALRCFLAEYEGSSGTHRIYARECERLFLWSVHVCRKPVSSLTRQDFESYIEFLADPGPAEIWCGPKRDRSSGEWRPFVGPLGQSAIMTAVSAINSMMRYWVDGGYLVGNPLGLIRQKRRMVGAQEALSTPKTDSTSKSAAPKGRRRAGSEASYDDERLARPRKTVDPLAFQRQAKISRFLDADMWNAVNAAVEAMPRGTSAEADEYERLRFICALLYMLAPRAGELETHTMGSFTEERGLWWWNVLGKGQKLARVPVPDDMFEALVRYRKHLGLSAAPPRGDVTPLLVSTHSKQLRGITARRLNQILKDLFHRAALELPPSLAHKAEKLRKASAHWGRHTGITAKVDSGMEERYVQRDARHADRRTTDLYVHEEERKWHEESQKQRLPWQSSGS